MFKYIYIFFFLRSMKTTKISHCCAAQRALNRVQSCIKGYLSLKWRIFCLFLPFFSLLSLYLFYFYFCGLSHFCHIHAPFSFQKLFLPLFSTALEKSHRNKCIGACLFFHLPFFGQFTIRQSLYWNTNLPSSCLENAAILHWTFDILMPK